MCFVEEKKNTHTHVTNVHTSPTSLRHQLPYVDEKNKMKKKNKIILYPQHTQLKKK